MTAITFFVGTTTPGDRWKIYLPTAALAKTERSLDSTAASALLRSRWSDAAAHQRLSKLSNEFRIRFQRLIIE